MSLDIEKLKRVECREDGSKVAECPACAERGVLQEGGGYLFILPGGAYGCALFPIERGYSSVERDRHLKRIFKLAGNMNPDWRPGYYKPRGNHPRYVGG